MPPAPVKPTAVKLPIDVFLPQIQRILEDGPCLVLEAAPGAGKTTRVPPAVLACAFRGDREIWVLEPRRLAAKMAAERVAEESGERVGETIGYQFRFESVISARTRVRFLTEGMLLRQMLDDPRLERVAAVILDEFHERHLQTDLALALLRRLQTGVRPDLRLVVMSATLDAEAVARYLGNAPRVRVEGRQFDVQLEYRAGASVLEAVTASLERFAREPALRGDVLVFLPGMAEIRRAQSALGELARAEDLLLLPLHAELPKEEQARAIGRAPAGKTKIILSTNVAETSVTIDGVTAVIDGGYARVASHSPWSGLPLLRTRPISRASAIQRAGRAGRTRPGFCLRLYARGDFEGRPAYDLPEIQRADLSQALLEMRALGVEDETALDWFEPPPAAALRAARELLVQLGALTGGRHLLTEIGVKLVRFPAHPRIARVLVEASRRGVLAEAARAAVWLTDGDGEGIDLLADLEPRNFARALQTQPRLRWLVERFERIAQGLATSSRSQPVGIAIGTHPTVIPVVAPVRDAAQREKALAFSILTGFPDRVARLRTQAQRGAELFFAGGESAQFPRGAEGSPVLAESEYFVVPEVEETQRLGQSRAERRVRSLVPIQADWLMDLEPSQVEDQTEWVFDPTRLRVLETSALKYGQLVLSQSTQDPTDREAASRVLVDELCRTGTGQAPTARLAQVCDLEVLEEFFKRLGFLRTADPGAAWPAWTFESFQEPLREFCRDKISYAEVREGDFAAFVQYRLPTDLQRRMEEWAPETVALGRGRNAKVHYEAGKPPWIESRLQDFFGMADGPRLGGGRLPLTLHLLAPNYRAVQVTSDLRGFWERHYPAARKDLGRRYPRHDWPENPLAVPTAPKPK